MNHMKKQIIIQIPENHSQILVGVLVPDDADDESMVCNGTFYHDTKCEQWARCVVCEEWAHNGCAGCENDLYVYDLCKYFVLNIISYNH